MHKKMFTMLVGLSGLCAILFISIHLIVNSLVVFDSINASGGIVYNQVNHFIYSNPFAKTFESLIAIGFLCHIFMASVHALQKLKKEATLSSAKEMLILGLLIFCFLIMHLLQFRLKTDVTSVIINNIKMDNMFLVVFNTLSNSKIYCLIYMITGILLGLHMHNGFLSMMKKTGKNSNNTTQKIATTFGIFFSVGFVAIPLYFIFA